MLKIAARVQNLLKARTDIKTFEYTIPKSMSKSLEADAGAETISELADAKAETTTRSATGGPEPPEDPDKNSIANILKRISKNTKNIYYKKNINGKQPYLTQKNLGMKY